MKRFLTRKNAVLVTVITVVVIGVWAGLSSLLMYLSQRVVTITLGADVMAVTVTSRCSQNCSTSTSTTLTNTAHIRLTDGDYIATPSGDSIDTTPIAITVSEKTTAFTIEPGYSEEHLAGLLDSQYGAAQAALLAAYPAAGIDYNLNKGKLYERGEWYATSLTPTGAASGDAYYSILHKVGNTWQVAASPRLYFSYESFPAVPKTLLYDVNSGML